MDAHAEPEHPREPRPVRDAGTGFAVTQSRYGGPEVLEPRRTGHPRRSWAGSVSPSDQRVVRHGKIITAAGCSGIDMALTLVGLTHGPAVAQAVQLAIQYDPEPPFDAGTPAKAPTQIGELVRAHYTQRS